MCFKRLKLPYPEEKANYSQTIHNVSPGVFISAWLYNYMVPLEYYDHWHNAIAVKVTLEIWYPAQTYDGGDGKRHLEVRPEWLNPGVIAHEQAHNSYSLLSDTDKQFFGVVYNELKTTDPYIKLLYKTNPYGLSSDIEGHAEVYRYIGYKMPEVLKQYYPKLF